MNRDIRELDLNIVGAMDYTVDTLFTHELHDYVTNVVISPEDSRRGIVNVYLTIPLRLQVDPLGYTFKLMDGNTVRFETDSMREEHQRLTALEEKIGEGEEVQ